MIYRHTVVVVKGHDYAWIECETRQLSEAIYFWLKSLPNSINYLIYIEF